MFSHYDIDAVNGKIVGKDKGRFQSLLETDALLALSSMEDEKWK